MKAYWTEGQAARMRHRKRCVIALAVLLLIPNMLHAQSCSRNMLSIAGSRSYIAVPDAPALHLTHGFTIECWAKRSSFTHAAALIDKGNSMVSFFGLFADTGSVLFGSVHRSQNLRIYAPQIDSIETWHHLALVFQPNDSLYFYIDSFEVASVRTTISILDSSIDSLRIGASALGTSWIGSIDELRIWNIPRSLTAIRTNLFHTLAGNDSGLVLYYSFDDETESPIVHDFSGNKHDGYIRGLYADIVPSSAPMLDSSRGFRLASKELRLDIPPKRCVPSFDTVIHMHNVGTSPLIVNSMGFYRGQAFSIVTSFPL
ncbi:MAG TPA: LamG domain-containing protein, partial [Candidatus Kapabacteria bacterium]|nr:LamG domain-containing protein [Candidatus Kapabacteria bacterium]